MRDKSYRFALDIIRIAKQLQFEQREFVLSKQILRSGTSIGALLREAEFAASHADYINKFIVALKEANETQYWLKLLKESGYMSPAEFTDLSTTCKELIAMLVASLKTLKLKN